MKIEIWSDFVCPFCYMGERKLELALNDFAGKNEVEIEFRSFELSTSNADYIGKDIHQVIADKYQISYEEAKANNERIVAAAAKVGLTYRFDILKPNTTRLAHEIFQYAKKQGKGNVVAHRFFKAYFEAGVDIGDKEALLSLLSDLDFDWEALSEQLKDGTLEAFVLADERQANAMQLDFVPYFLINGTSAIQGALESEQMLMALNEAYQNS